MLVTSIAVQSSKVLRLFGDSVIFNQMKKSHPIPDPPPAMMAWLKKEEENPDVNSMCFRPAVLNGNNYRPLLREPLEASADQCNLLTRAQEVALLPRTSLLKLYINRQMSRGTVLIDPFAVSANCYLPERHVGCSLYFYKVTHAYLGNI